MAGIATAFGPEQADLRLTLVFAAAVAAVVAAAADWTCQQQQQE